MLEFVSTPSRTTHVWFMSPMGSTPQLNGLEAKIWESPLALGLGTKLGLLGPLLIYIGLHTRLWVWNLGTAYEGVRYLRSLDLWAGLHFVLIDHIKIKKLLKEPKSLPLNIHHALNKITHTTCQRLHHNI